MELLYSHENCMRAVRAAKLVKMSNHGKNYFCCVKWHKKLTSRRRNQGNTHILPKILNLWENDRERSKAYKHFFKEDKLKDKIKKNRKNSKKLRRKYKRKTKFEWTHKLFPVKTKTVLKGKPFFYDAQLKPPFPIYIHKSLEMLLNFSSLSQNIIFTLKQSNLSTLEFRSLKLIINEVIYLVV